MRKPFVNYNLCMVLERESYKQIYIHKGLCVFKKKEAELIKMWFRDNKRFSGGVSPSFALS